MQPSKTKKITASISRLCVLTAFLVHAGGFESGPATAAEGGESPPPGFPVPVSINALMVTMIDHSAHYIWDYASVDTMVEDEWLAVEYYAIQLAAAGPLLTLGGSGEADSGWASSPRGLTWSRDMSAAAMKAINAAELQDRELLNTAGDELLDSCLGCHRAFKPDIPTEGIEHDPLYDRLYHLFQR